LPKDDDAHAFLANLLRVGEKRSRDRLLAVSIWETIATEAATESALWRQALRPWEQRELRPVFSPLGSDRFALAVESIYEGYLLHYGRPRLFSPADPDTAVLLGDYLYAHGLVRLAGLGDVGAVSDLAELISLCTQLRADRSGLSCLDGAAWAGTASALGSEDGRLPAARSALRLERDPSLLEAIAIEVAGSGATARALAAHGELVE
jgi:hypothetical protein